MLEFDHSNACKYSKAPISLELTLINHDSHQSIQPAIDKIVFFY